jgi:hypothetical protein
LRDHPKASSEESNLDSTDRRCFHRRALVSVLAITILSALALVAPMANAAAPIDSYAYYTTFGAGGGSSFGPTYNGIAVENSTGRIFLPVYGGEGPKILVYSPDPVVGGVLLTSADGEIEGDVAANVASDPSNGSIYVEGSIFGAIGKLASDDAPTPTYTADPGFTGPSGSFGVAVDPITHDVLVANGSNVSRLDHVTGAIISSFDGSDTEAGTFGAGAKSLAVGPTGTIYVVDNGLRRRVERMSPGGESLGALSLAEGVLPRSVAVNPDSGEVVVLEERADGTYEMEGLTPTGQHVFSIRLPSSMSGVPLGLAIDPNTDRIYVADEAGFVFVFEPAIQPGVDAPTISAIAGESVHADAAVAPGGVPAEAWIEYCLASDPCSDFSVSDPADLENPWIRGPEHTGLEGSGEEHVADDFSGLEVNTAYLFRAHAENARTETTSGTTSATTALIPPFVETAAAAEVTTTGALLAGTIGTYGDQTTFHFEYGLSDDYGSNVPAGAEGIAGNERASRTFTRHIAGLQPDTTYHYRLVAKNSAGVAFGADRTFTTLTGAGEQRAYELVTPVDKGGAVLATSFAQAAADGSGLEYAVTAPSTASNSVPMVTRFLTQRGPSGWSTSIPLDPPVSMMRWIAGGFTLAVSKDFAHSLVVSNKVLAPGATEQGGNIYIRNLDTGKYTLVGTSDAPDAFLSMTSNSNFSQMFLAGAPDFSWVVFNSRTPLMQGVSGAAMYRWSASGGLELESRLPDGSIPGAPVQLPGLEMHTAPWVPEDGDTAYFGLDSFSGDVGVYRSENGVTVPISVSHRLGDDPTVTQFGFLDGVSSEGRYAFFHSVQLTEDAPPAFPNIYRYDAVTGDLDFIATMKFGGSNGTSEVKGISKDGSTMYFNDQEDHLTVWHDGQTHVVGAALPSDGQAWPSSNGRYLVFPSDGDLQLYDLAANQTSCMSCTVAGSEEGKALLPFNLRDISAQRPLVVTDDGLAFFTSTARLVAADHNGARDVYSFKDGVLTLISPGDQSFDATYAGASADGRDVFFGTAQALVARDTDDAVDIYDARIGGGGFAEPPPPPPQCQGDACKAPFGAAPPAPTLGSAAASGHGNAKHKGRGCPKGKHKVRVRKKTRCVKKRGNAHTHRAHMHSAHTKYGGGR